MTRFRNSVEYAKNLVIKRTCHRTSRIVAESQERKVIRSLGTEYKYRSCIKIFLEWCKNNRHNNCRVDRDLISDFLRENATRWSQKTLDGYRQALQLVFEFEIDYVVSEKPSFLIPRSYSIDQIEYLCSNAVPSLAMSIQIAAFAGLRAIELDSIASTYQMNADDRPWLESRFEGLGSGVKYIVVGKGGLRRQVFLSHVLSEKLEHCRFDSPIIKTSRRIHYQKRFSIIGGQMFSQQFSRLSKNVLGWSTGAHGLRHSYARNRLETLQRCGYLWRDAVEIVSQEMGHFSIANTLTYFR